MLEWFANDWGGFFITENATVKLEAFLKVILCFKGEFIQGSPRVCDVQPRVRMGKPQWCLQFLTSPNTARDGPSDPIQVTNHYHF